MLHTSIKWEYVGTELCTWRGTSQGLLCCTIIFTITSTKRYVDEYLVQASTKAITAKICNGIDAAKNMALELFMTYVFSIMLP